MTITFRLPRNKSDADLLAVARTFAESAAPLAAAFVEYGLPENFVADLNADITAFQSALGASAPGRGEQVAATAQIGELIRRGMVAVRILDGVVRNKYCHNVGKLAAWTSASHIQRPPKSTPPPPGNP